MFRSRITMFDKFYPVGDFIIKSLGNDNRYKLVLFLNTNEPSWQDIKDPSVYMYKYGMARGTYNEKENAIEVVTGYDGVKRVIMYLRRYKGMEREMIELMEEVLANELERSYTLV